MNMVGGDLEIILILRIKLMKGDCFHSGRIRGRWGKGLEGRYEEC